MEASELQPVVLITTVQPYLMLWVMVIAFFVALSIVAALSRGRSWGQLFLLFAIAFIVSVVAGTAATHWLTTIELLEVEVIQMAKSR